MTDSPILTPAELDARLSAIRRQGTGEPVPGRPRDAIHAHDAALRAALAAAEERAAEAEAKAHHFDNQCVDNWREVIRLREELADQRERIGAWSAEWSAKLAAAEERAERAEQTAEAQMTIVYAAEAQVRTLREFVRHGDECFRYETVGGDWHGVCTCGLDAALGEKPMKHSDLPKHCSTCGIDWPEGANAICPSCGAGLCCRADTTDTVAPDPPCAGSRLRLKEKNDGT